MKIYFTNEFMNTKGESHELLALAIADYTASDAQPYIDRMEIGELGKPTIAGLDDFSISHSRNVWAVLFDSNPCGLDVQEHREINIDRIANKWFHEDDVKLLAATQGPDKIAAFYRIWARREALVKSMGTSILNRSIQGRALTPDFEPRGQALTSNQALNSDQALATIQGQATDIQFEGQLWKIMDVTIPGAEDMSAAVCCKELTEIEFIDIETLDTIHIGGCDAR